MARPKGSKCCLFEEIELWLRVVRKPHLISSHTIRMKFFSSNKLCSSCPISRRIRTPQAVKVVIGGPAKGVTPTNVDNLSTAGRQLVSVTEEPTVFYDSIRSGAMVRREKEKAYV